MPEVKAPTIDVAYVANLARLELTGEEIARFQGQLDQIVQYVQKMGELDLDGVEPTAHAQPLENVFRADTVRDGLPRESVLQNAPKRTEDQFLVPKIVE